ncbi:NfeD family protein [Fibrobacterota bacterium]
MTNIWVPIVLQLGAILVGVAEIIIPSFGMLTVIALGLLGYSWYYIISHLPQAAAWGFFIADAILVPVFIKVAFSMLKASPLAHGKKLDHGTGLENTVLPGKELMGMTGRVDSQLRPAGKALINNRLFEVHSEIGIIEKDTDITVIDVVGNKIIVEPINKP